LRLREEKNRKYEEHRQRVKALEEAEYKIYDEERAKAADQLEWMAFETKVRDYIKNLVTPVFTLATEER
jgi:hypothetical protein